MRLGTGDGTFGTAATKTVASEPTNILVADFNRDTTLDIFFASNFSAVQFLAGSGNGTFADAVAGTIITASEYLPNAIVLGDVTHDGWLDILTSNAALDTFAVFVNAGGGTFELPRNFAGSSGDGLGLANLNGDTKLDVVTVGDFGLMVSLNAS